MNSEERMLLSIIAACLIIISLHIVTVSSYEVYKIYKRYADRKAYEAARKEQMRIYKEMEEAGLLYFSNSVSIGNSVGVRR
jgi:hypothetical protein